MTTSMQARGEDDGEVTMENRFSASVLIVRLNQKAKNDLQPLLGLFAALFLTSQLIDLTYL